MKTTKEVAVIYADRAAQADGEEAMTDAIGTGLAAVAYALLELADKVDDVRREMTSLREEQRG